MAFDRVASGRFASAETAAIHIKCLRRAAGSAGKAAGIQEAVVDVLILTARHDVPQAPNLAGVPGGHIDPPARRADPSMTSSSDRATPASLPVQFGDTHTTS